MIFTDLRLQQYRSYSDSSFELGEGVNIVVGSNAAGKTNLLESVMVSCTGKSYRAKDINLIQSGKDWARIDLHTSENILRTTKLQIDTAGRLQKTFVIDDKEYKRLPKGQKQPVVLFEPNDMQLIENEPSVRREYMDNLIEQISPEYDRTRNHYKRALAQRNALLKQGAHGASQLFAWNLRLADLGTMVVTKRLELIQALNATISKVYKGVSGHDKKVEIRYESSLPTDNYSTNLLKKLESSKDLDIARGFTGSGPHRDEFIIYFKNEPAILSASRGELRTLTLALKIIELEVLEKELGLRPLLLLDDVFSELDGARRKALTGYISNYQTIITTTDADMAVNNFSNTSQVIAL